MGEIIEVFAARRLGGQIASAFAARKFSADVKFVGFANVQAAHAFSVFNAPLRAILGTIHATGAISFRES
jgi:hypothetical protein